MAELGSSMAELGATHTDGIGHIEVTDQAAQSKYERNPEMEPMKARSLALAWPSWAPRTRHGQFLLINACFLT